MSSEKAPEPLYPPLDPVEVGEWLLYRNSFDDREFVQVERLTPKHIVLAETGEQFSRAHGAQWSPPAMYDAYLGRVRKLTPEEQAERVAADNEAELSRLEEAAYRHSIGEG